MRFKNVIDSFSVAWSQFWSLAAIHLTFRLLAVAIVAPTIGLIIALSIQLSHQKALTDQDIAAFVLSPVGAIVAIAVVSLVIASLILDFTAMSAALLLPDASPIAILRKSVAFVAANFLKLVLFCNGLILRVLVLAAPFIAVSAYIAFVNLTEFDINYYLTYWPPVFVKTVVLIGFLLLVMLGTLIFFLSGWAIALHLYLGKKIGVGAALKESRQLLEGHRANLIIHILIWGVIRLAVLAVIALIFSGLTVVALDQSGVSLRFVVILLLLLFAFWGIVNISVTALINGALASILLKFFETATGIDSQKQTIITREHHLPKINIWAVVVGAVGVILIAAVFLGAVLEQVKVNASVQIIAHRGAAALRPENTMAAIEKAIEDKTDWVEIDVQESAEGEIIVAHDSDFMKVADNPLKTWESTREELDRIDIGSWFDPTYTNERPPLLVDVLRAAKGRSNVVIELKYYGHTVDLEAEVIRIVEEEEMVDQVSLMSLKYSAVEKLRTLRPDWELGVLAAKAVGDVTQLDADFLALNSGQISAKLIRQAHKHEKVVYAWTVDDPVQMSSLITMGIDGLITNDPALARSVFEYYLDLTSVERFVLYFASLIDLSPLELVADDSDA